jgi:hypothetical protein
MLIIISDIICQQHLTIFAIDFRVDYCLLVSSPTKQIKWLWTFKDAGLNE